MGFSLRRRLERLASDRWARRALRTLLRSTWIGLSVLCLGLGLNLLFDLNLAPETLLAVALGCVAIGAASLLTRRMTAQEVAQRLDRRFGLHQQLSTALEVSNSDEAPEGAAVYLLDQAQRTSAQAQRYIQQHRRRPWSDAIALLALLLVGLGLYLMVGLTPPGSQPVAEPLPPLQATPPAANTDPEASPQQQQAGQPQAGNGQANQQLVEQQAPGSSFDQQSAAALADALRDQSATRPAADALDQGNTEAAAQNLRELADQADQLSATTRRDLADQLRNASARIEQNNSQLAEQVRQSAYGLQQSGQSSADALENLANAVEQLDGSSGEQSQQQAQQEGQQDQQGQQNQGQSGGGVGNAPMGEQREQSHERLGVDGVPLELEGQGDGGSPGDEDTPEQVTSSRGGTFQAGQSEVTDEQVKIGADPLRIPTELRDVVQEYFSPTQE
jgi:hypothetical protein